MSAVATRTLDGPPGAATLYPRAVAGALALPLVRRVPIIGGWAGGGPRDALPDLELELTDLALDAAHVAAYARVCGFDLRDTLPGTYLHVLAFPLAMRLMTDSAFPFGVLGLVHIANRIDHHRPVRLGETPSLRVRAEDLRPHDRGRQFDVVAEARVDGELVWEDRSTYLRRGSDTAPATKDATRSVDRAAPPAPAALWELPGDLGRRYGAVSGDRNPIHLHGLSARLFGQPQAIAHGMWLKARCLAALQPAAPDAYTIEARFKRPVPLPSTVAFSSWAPAPGARSFAVHGARRPLPHLEGGIAPR